MAPVSETSNLSSVLPCGIYGYGETEDYTLNIIDKSTSVETNMYEKTVHIIPNPNYGKFMVNLQDYNIADTQISIYSLSGQMIYNSKVDDDIINIDLSNHSKGIYFIKINTNNEVVSDKIMIK